MKIYVKQLYDEKGNKISITLPERGSEVAAGYDIVATSDPKIVGTNQVVTIAGKEYTLWANIDYIEYETNLFIAPEAKSFHVLIHPRSSVSKYNLVLANSIGLIDNDYRGMVICRFKYIAQPKDWVLYATDVAMTPFADDQIVKVFGGLHTLVDAAKIYKKGDKIAQLVIEPTVTADWELVNDLTQTQRGTGGFGSTDKTGKPLTEMFAEEQKKFEARKNEPQDSILNKYNQVGGIPTQLPYSERMKQRLEHEKGNR